MHRHQVAKYNDFCTDYQSPLRISHCASDAAGGLGLPGQNSEKYPDAKENETREFWTRPHESVPTLRRRTHPPHQFAESGI